MHSVTGEAKEGAGSGLGTSTTVIGKLVAELVAPPSSWVAVTCSPTVRVRSSFTKRLPLEKAVAEPTSEPPARTIAMAFASTPES